ncbi:MAG: DUF3142 domain-containing protein [Verrucomicrobiota bacterium]
MLSISTGCKRGKSRPAPLPQRTYVWQREWNPQVLQAVDRSRADLAGYVMLACEIEWRNGKPNPVRTKVDWQVARSKPNSFSPAIRVMPYPGPFSEGDETATFLCNEARKQVEAIRAAGIEPRELQLDFDCAQKKLAGYAMWVRSVRRAIAPLPLVITVLPCWLDEADFPNLVREASSYVLQVHSVASPRGDEHTMVCDPALARSWVARASKIGVPFEISLPTYRTLTGYDSAGLKLGSYSDAVRPSWPPGTTVREYATDLDAMAALVASWQTTQPTHCKGLLWYRLPVDEERNNCSWPALRSMMQGRAPARSTDIRVNGKQPDEMPVSLADISLVNTGETDSPSLAGVTVKWDEPANLSAAEPLPGWRVIRDDHKTTFRPVDSTMRLTPGSERAIGWMRFEKPAILHVQALP